MDDNHIQRIAELLHSAGLNTLTHPQDKSASAWNSYRLNLATRLVESGVRVAALLKDEIKILKNELTIYSEKADHFDKLEQLTYDYATGKTDGNEIIKYVKKALDGI